MLFSRPMRGGLGRNGAKFFARDQVYNMRQCHIFDVGQSYTHDVQLRPRISRNMVCDTPTATHNHSFVAVLE